MYLNI